MINVVLGKRKKYCLMARQSVATVGKQQNRVVVEVEIYYRLEHGKLLFINKGVALCHPTDTFNPRTGAQKALASALEIGAFSKEERRKFFDALNSWF